MDNSKDDLKRARTSRVQLLHEARQGECSEGCSSQWLACAKEVLERNGISIQYFARCVLDLSIRERELLRCIREQGDIDF